jgi:hypothetical protein
LLLSYMHLCLAGVVLEAAQKTTYDSDKRHLAAREEAFFDPAEAFQRLSDQIDLPVGR